MTKVIHFGGEDKPWERPHPFAHFWIPYSPVL
jgi:hypothetical protein